MRKNYALAAFTTAALTIFAGVGNASPVALAFTTTLAGGSWAITNGGGSFTTGNNYALSSMSGVLFKTLTVTNDPIPADNQAYTITGTGTGNCTSSSGGTLQMSSNTLTLYGAITGLSGISTGCNALLTMTGSFTGTYITNSSGQFAFAGLTSIGGDAQLLADLGLTGYSSALAAGSGINTSGGSVASGIDTYTANSEQFTLNLTAAPEPLSFGLMGAGLAALIFKARKRASRAA
jgi:hypothetical protein